MSWTAVHTFAVGDVLNASDLNTWLSNNTQFLFQPPSVGVTHSTTITVTSATPRSQPYDTERWKNTDTGMHSTSSNNDRLIAVTAGVYICHIACQWANNTGGNFRQAGIAISGVSGTLIEEGAWPPGPPAGVGLGRTAATVVHKFAAADYWTAYLNHDAGGTITINKSNQYTPEAQMVWVSN